MEVEANAGESVLRRGARLFRRFVRAHPAPFAAAVAGSALFAATAVLSTVVLGRATDRVLVPAFETGDVPTDQAWLWAAAILGVAVLRSLGVVGRRFFAGTTGNRNARTLREAVAERFLDVPLAFHRVTPTGELLAHADNDVDVAVDALHPLPFSVGLAFLLLFAAVSMFLTDPLLGLIALVIFPAMALLNRYYTHRVEAPATRVQERVGEVSSIAHESFEGALVVKTLGLERREVGRMREASERLRSERMQVGALRALFEPTLDALPTLGTIAVLLIGAWRVSTDAITTGQLVQVMALFGLLAFPMRVFGFLLEELPRSVVALERLDRFLATESATTPGQGHALPAGPLAVTADDVHFGYGGEPVLTGCSFTIAPGEVVALVGATGAGKSTLCELLAGLAPPSSGVLRLGGVDLRALDADQRRAATALVFQESFLFADTVRANLVLGGEVPDAALHAALRVAQAESFVAALPSGLATVLGERGVTLSGGQRQRLALARALLRRPRFLLLDDATSAVDPTVEARILRALRSELAMTTLLVAHRVSTIELADRVLFLREGRIVADGSHVELLLGDADYHTLVRAYERETTP